MRGQNRTHIKTVVSRPAERILNKELYRFLLVHFERFNISTSIKTNTYHPVAGNLKKKKLFCWCNTNSHTTVSNNRRVLLNTNVTCNRNKTIQNPMQFTLRHHSTKKKLFSTQHTITPYYLGKLKLHPQLNVPRLRRRSAIVTYIHTLDGKRNNVFHKCKVGN